MIWLYITLGISGGIALIVLFVWFSNSWLKITRYKIKIEGAPSLKIVHLSDLHAKRFGKGNIRLIKKTQKESPDLIAVTGDIIHRYNPKNRAVALECASALKEVAPVFYISGNHEMRGMQYRFLRKDLMEAGITVLDDEAIEFNGVQIVGLNCANLKNDKIFKITPKASPKILLAHKPHFFERYANAGYDLVLSGHAHGGQWRIPFTNIGIFSPGQGLFPKYTSGVHILENTKMVISRGLGNSQCPIRLFNRPEILVININ